MSISASINISLSGKGDEDLLLLDLFKNFVHEGWEYMNSQGEVTILPLGDVDQFNWISVTLDKDSLFNLLEQKRDQKEIIGVELLRADSEVGCELLILNAKQMMFSLSIARKKIKTIDNSDITDFSWYLDRILRVFGNIHVEQIVCEQLL